MKIPYGKADFYRIVKEGRVYVDRTDRIRALEEIGDELLFLRPRRFGKSLWIRTLSCYYDLRYRDEHEQLFGGLAVGADPTELAHSYFVLEWDFSAISVELSPGDLGALLNGYVNTSLEGFLSDYREHLPGTLTLGEVALENFAALLTLVRRTPYRLCLLVDEYDNFANDVMMSDPATYKGLVRVDGPLRGLMKWVKQAMKGQGIERLFFTGVSPIVMSDITSGMNILTDVSQHPRLADLCGFREDEIRDVLLEPLLAELAAAGVSLPGAPPLGTREAVEEALDMMRVWYNGYRFAAEAPEKIYNPTLVLYFLDRLQQYRRYPRQMLDANLAMDQGKLAYLVREVPGQQAVMNILQTGEPVEVNAILDRFSIDDMFDEQARDLTFVGSFLYYFGMLTLEGETDLRTLLLTPPNLVTRKLYIDHVRRVLLPEPTDRSGGTRPALALMGKGDIEPLATYVEQKIFRLFSNPDYKWMNEFAVKTAFLTLLFNDTSYMILSEPELERGRADLCLLRRPDARTDALWDLLLEFKYVSRKKLGLPGKKLRELSREELLKLGKVRDAFAEAEEQLDRYRGVLARQLGAALRLRCYAVVTLGFERLLVREHTEPGARPSPPTPLPGGEGAGG